MGRRSPAAAGGEENFYTRALGLQVAHEDLAKGSVFLSFGREHHELALFQGALEEAPGPARAGMHHMAWKLASFEQLQAAYRELKAMDMKVEATIEHNVTRSIYFPDPDGNRVEFYGDMVETASRPCAPSARGLRPLNLEEERRTTMSTPHRGCSSACRSRLRRGGSPVNPRARLIGRPSSGRRAPSGVPHDEAGSLTSFERRAAAA